MKNNRFCALAVLLFFASVYSLFCIGHYGGDGYGDYLTAESIVLDGNLSLYDRPGDVDELNYIQDLGTKGRDGKIYSSRSSLGTPIILSLFYFLGHIVAGCLKNLPHDFITMFFVSFANPIILALSCLSVFIIAGELGFSQAACVTLSMIYGLATMIPVYARTGFADPTLVLFLLISIYLSLKYKSSGKLKFLVMGALTSAYMVFTRPSAFIFLPCLAFYILWLISKRNKGLGEKIKESCYFIIPVSACLLLIGFYNWYIYGNMFKFGGQEAISTGKRLLESPHILKGLYYYLFSTGKGFFIFNLPLVLSLIGIFQVPRKRRKEAVLLITICLVNLLFFVKSFRRGSLFSWGPRYLLPSIAVLIFFIGDFYERYKGVICKISLGILSLAGFFILLPCMFINQSKFYFFVKAQLRLDEYLVNFIPDLSPIYGAWRMFISRILLKLTNTSLPFVYNPDYRLFPSVTASMEKYNYFDFWFLKIIHFAPHYKNLVLMIMGILVLLALVSLFIIIKNISEHDRSKSPYTHIKL